MSDEVLYDQQVIEFLEDIWGDGFLSPGGTDEVRRVLQGVTVDGKLVIDIGCGSGACAILLAKEYHAKRVVGIDVEKPVCDAATNRVKAEGVSDKVQIQLVEPGPLPFTNDEVDVVFSKDAIIHIPDKETMALDAFRILKPGGQFAASDWLISHDNDPSPQMADYIKAEGLDFAMASPTRYANAMKSAGFIDIELVNRNSWYATEADKELQWLKGPKRSELQERHGKDFIDHQVEIWSKLVTVLKSGEHCPHHIRARKPF